MTNAVVQLNQTNVTANLSAIPLQQKYSGSVTAVFSDATASGTLKVQISNDKSLTAGLLPEQFVPTNWVDLSGASATVASGANAIIPKIDLSYQYMRMVWTRSAGAGTFQVNVNVQGF